MGQLVYAGGRDGVPQIPLILCKECSTIFVPHGRFQKPPLSISSNRYTFSNKVCLFLIFFHLFHLVVFGHLKTEYLCEDYDDVQEDADC